MSSNLLQLKQAMRATWMAGDFRQIARYMEREAEAFVERLGNVAENREGSGSMKAV
jgi:hypothetical protein